ncbi:MAG: formyltransferase family protein [Nanoarchaeota archaeon]
MGPSKEQGYETQISFQPLYDGSYDDFTWVGLGSGSGTNLRECAKLIPPELIISNRKNAELLSLEELADVPKHVIESFPVIGRWSDAEGDPEEEMVYWENLKCYNEMILEHLTMFELSAGKSIDLLVLGGFMLFVTDPLLSAYQDKIITVHPADLSKLDASHQRKYTGKDALADAIMAGEEETRSSVILVDELPDHGEILTQGAALDVQDYAEIYVHDPNEFFSLYQMMQKRRSDWPALTTALEYIAEGRFSLSDKPVFHNEWRQVMLNDLPLPYHGYRP